MALRQQNLRHEQIGVGTLILAPGADESYRIIDIRHFLGRSTFLVGFVDRDAIWLGWRYQFTLPIITDTVDDYASPIHSGRLLHRMPGQFPIPIESGQVFTIPGVGNGDEVLVIYDVYDRGDVARTEHNGTDGKTHSWIQLITYRGAEAWGSRVRMDALVSPAEFLDFPVRENVPANRRVTVEAIAGIPVVELEAQVAIGRTVQVDWTRNRERITGEVAHGHWFLAPLTDPTRTATVWHAYRSTIGHLDVLAYNSIAEPFNYEARAKAIMEHYAYSPPLAFDPGDDVDLWVSTEDLNGANPIGDNLIRLLLACTEEKIA